MYNEGPNNVLLTCLVCVFVAGSVAGISFLANRSRNIAVIETALEADAHVDILEDNVTSIEMAAKEAVVDNEQQYLLNFYYNYKLKDMPVAIPAFEIIYSVDKETYDKYVESFNDSSLKKRTEMIESLTTAYDPIKVFDHMLEDDNVFAQ